MRSHLSINRGNMLALFGGETTALGNTMPLSKATAAASCRDNPYGRGVRDRAVEVEPGRKAELLSALKAPLNVADALTLINGHHACLSGVLERKEKI